MKQFVRILIFFIVANVNCNQIHYGHQLTTLQVETINEWTHQNLRHDQRHHQLDQNQQILCQFCTNCLLGATLLILSLLLIWFNEKKAVLDYLRLNLAYKNCQQVDTSIKLQVAQKQGKLVYISGVTQTVNPITDQISTLTVEGALRLIRTVEVMEWRVKNSSPNQQQTQYALKWCTSNQSISQDKKNSPENWFINSQIFYNTKVFIGQYNMSDTQIQMCKKIQKVTLNKKIVQHIRMQKNIKQKVIIKGDYAYFLSPVNNKINGEGALRIKYEYCPVGSISIVAKTSSNSSFSPFDVISHHQKEDQKISVDVGSNFWTFVSKYFDPISKINFLQQSELSKQEVFNKKYRQSLKFAFIARGITFFMMAIGVCLIHKAIIDTFGFDLFIGGFLKESLTLFEVIEGILISIPLWIIISSIAWIWYDPKIGLIAFGIGFVILNGILFYNQFSLRNTQQITQNPSTIHYHFMRLRTH